MVRQRPGAPPGPAPGEVDGDGDGFTRVSIPPDCNDANKIIHPGAREVAGNKVDENCESYSAPFESIGATPGSSFKLHGSKTTVKKLDLTKIPTGVTLTITCKGSGCAFKTKTLKPHGSAHLAKLFKGRKLGAGATIEVSLTKAEEISQIVRSRHSLATTGRAKNCGSGT